MAVEKNQEPTNAEIMQERGVFVANGYTFSIEPIYLGEEAQYIEDVPLSLYPRDAEEDISDKRLAEYAMFVLFRPTEQTEKKIKNFYGVLESIKTWLVKLTNKDYRYYSNAPNSVGLVKWIEKKVSCKGKKIKFYDLERKYGLTKAEIVRMLGYFEKMSGF